MPCAAFVIDSRFSKVALLTVFVWDGIRFFSLPFSVHSRFSLLHFTLSRRSRKITSATTKLLLTCEARGFILFQTNKFISLQIVSLSFTGKKNPINVPRNVWFCSSIGSSPHLVSRHGFESRLSQNVPSFRLSSHRFLHVG